MMAELVEEDDRGWSKFGCLQSPLVQECHQQGLPAQLLERDGSRQNRFRQ